MWPLLLDLSRDESKRILRRLELEAYSSLISAFRAQGILTKDKKKILKDLQHVLSISTERHRAEVRRAVNDEQLATIADKMCGPSTDADWLIEGRRLIPLMPRLVPQTAFTVTANQAVNLQVEKNAAMPNPMCTGNRDWGVVAEEEEEVCTKKKRSMSVDNISSVCAGTQTPRASANAPPNTPSVAVSSNPLQGISPVKITISKNSQMRNQNTTAVATQTQKVILVSTSGAGPSSGSNVLPLVKSLPTLTTTGSGGHHPKMSIVMPGATNTSPATVSISNGNLGNIITVVTTSNTSSKSTSTNTTAVLGTASATFLPSSINITKPRAKSVPRQKLPQFGQKPGVVIPVGQPALHSAQGGQTVQSIQIKPNAKSAIQIKHEGGMKIITQSVPAAGSKILPKPSQSGTPVVVVSGVSTTTTTATTVTRPVSTISVSQAGNSKILNINAQAGKVITTTKTANVVTVNPKTLHLTAVKSSTGGTVSRPNVIVVTKAPPKRSNVPISTAITKGTQELVSFIHKQGTNPVSSSSLKSSLEKKIIVTTVPESLKRQQSQTRITDADSGKTSTLLAELIQAAGILPDTQPSDGQQASTIAITDVAIAAAVEEPVEIISAAAGTQLHTNTTQTKISSQGVSSNEWFEYDVTEDQHHHHHHQSSTTTTTTNDSTSTDTISAALLEMQQQQQPNNGNLQLKHKEIIKSSTDIGNLTDQINQQNIYTLDQALTILNQDDKASQLCVASSVDPLTFLNSSTFTPINISKQIEEPMQVTVSTPDVSNTVEVPICSDTPPTSPIPAELVEHLSPGGEELLQGELDPQTGLFYTVIPTSESTNNNNNDSVEIIGDSSSSSGGDGGASSSSSGGSSGDSSNNITATTTTSSTTTTTTTVAADSAASGHTQDSQISSTVGSSSSSQPQAGGGGGGGVEDVASVPMTTVISPPATVPAPSATATVSSSSSSSSSTQPPPPPPPSSSSSSSTTTTTTDNNNNNNIKSATTTTTTTSANIPSSTTTTTAATTTTTTTTKNGGPISSTSSSSSSSSSSLTRPLDLLSSSLAQAQIDLDTYHYIDESDSDDTTTTAVQVIKATTTAITTTTTTAATINNNNNKNNNGRSNNRNVSS
ncbi:BRCA2-interacting transcriptional repressor EMSY-like, partial [Argonauta hians]